MDKKMSDKREPHHMEPLKSIRFQVSKSRIKPKKKSKKKKIKTLLEDK
jgi:hypothetical protein